jgi:hypothetical protein
MCHVPDVPDRRTYEKLGLHVIADIMEIKMVTSQTEINVLSSLGNLTGQGHYNEI